MDNTLFKMMCLLIQKYDYWNNKGELGKDGYFYCRHQDLTDALGINRCDVPLVIESLFINKFIDVKSKGFGKRMTTRYKINWNKIKEIEKYSVIEMQEKGIYFEKLKRGVKTTYDKPMTKVCANCNTTIDTIDTKDKIDIINNNTTIVLENSREENNKKENNIKEKETTMTTDELEAIRIARTANFNRKNTTTNVVNENQTTKVVNNNFNFNFEDVATKVTGNNSTLKYDTFIQWLQERLEKLDAMAQWQQSSYFNSIINFVNKWYPHVEDPKFSQELVLNFLKQHFNETNSKMFTQEPRTAYGKRVIAQ